MCLNKCWVILNFLYNDIFQNYDSFMVFNIIFSRETFAFTEQTDRQKTLQWLKCLSKQIQQLISDVFLRKSELI